MLACSDEFDHLPLRIRIDLSGWFVGDEDGRVGSQRDSQGSPSALAARELRGKRVRSVCETHRRQRLLRTASSVGAASRSDSRTFSSTVR
jgi:hypothetical protein